MNKNLQPSNPAPQVCKLHRFPMKHENLQLHNPAATVSKHHKLPIVNENLELSKPALKDYEEPTVDENVQLSNPSLKSCEQDKFPIMDENLQLSQVCKLHRLPIVIENLQLSNPSLKSCEQDKFSIMTENLQLPNPAPKGCANDKWKSMVDSVIGFISASRSLLVVLNDRIQESEKFNAEERKKIEEEKTKLAFYKDCLNLEIAPKLNKASATTSPLAVVSGDILEKYKQDHKMDNRSKNCKNCTKKERQDKTSTMQSSSIERSSKESQCNVKVIESNSKSMDVQTAFIEEVKCKKKCCKEENKLSSVISGETIILSGSKNTANITNFTKISRIPRTKSFSEDSRKNIERTPNEGTIGKCLSNKRYKESTYRNIHLKNKSPARGDSGSTPQL